MEFPGLVPYCDLGPQLQCDYVVFTGWVSEGRHGPHLCQHLKTLKGGMNVECPCHWDGDIEDMGIHATL